MARIESIIVKCKFSDKSDCRRSYAEYRIYHSEM